MVAVGGGSGGGGNDCDKDDGDGTPSTKSTPVLYTLRIGMKQCS